MTTIRRIFWRRAAPFYGLAGVFGVGMSLWGRLGDCRPHDIDGQCGMSTIFGATFGIVGAVLFIAVQLAHLSSTHPFARRRACANSHAVAVDERTGHNLLI
jgi:hypothetical protein